MRVAFTLTVLGQTFSISSKPEDAAPEDGPAMSAVSDTERDPVGFCATPEYYYEEEERRR